MAIKQVEQGKQNSYFRKTDLIIYGSILVVVALLFTIFFVKGREQQLDGIEIVYMGDKNITIFTYSFDSDRYQIHPAWQQLITITPTESGYVVVISNADQHERFNRMVIDCNERKVWVEEANCSLSRDCTRMDAIDNAEKVIVCVPHRLKILPLSPNYDNNVNLE
ncbi:MAG: NusG domain II-containing protein [Clostridia bacterium]|nr:NusG domain II-containing protein [Clostridia bacterium]